ncbi:MAG: DUF4595 domain-containing protein [Chitinophagales bacterium]|nr:DUF4595 domain-containing protein [Chitinophagales bacterium]
MRSSLLLLAICGVLFTSSCKKKEQFCKLGKFYATDGANYSTPNTFTYDAANRLIKIAYVDKTKDTLVYSADTLFVKKYDYRDTLLSLLSGLLNSNGSITSATLITFDASGNVTGTETYSLQYNADGTLSQFSLSNSSGNETRIYTYADGNRATGKLFVGGIEQEKYVFFHSTALNKTGIDDNNGVFTPYFGKPSKNLLDSLHIIAGGDTTRIRYTHQLDGNGYTIKTVRTYLPPSVDTKFFTYSYFDCRE